jgi:glycosyltransferase involved in cell wall biosynthesis
MSRAPRILLWSARFDSVDGQALVTRRVADHQPSVTSTRVVYEAGGGRAVLSALGTAFNAWGLIATGQANTAYVVCSRSILGFLRDVPILLAALLGIRVVVHTHGSDLIGLLNRGGVGRLARALYRCCEVIVPSSHMVEELRSLPCRVVHVCENFTLGFDEPAPSVRTASDPLHVLWNSNVLASKGFREVVEGLRLVREQGLPARLTVLGRPLSDAEATAEEMSEFLEILRVEDWVDIRGPVSPSKAREFVRLCDVVALPSRYPSECQPLAIIEAMCAGREIIVSATSALKATVGSYPAEIVLGDPDSIAAALARAAAPHPERPEELIRAAGQAQLRFSVERFDREMAQIFAG